VLKTLISKITGVSEERFDQLKAEIEGLISTKQSLEAELRELEKAKDSLGQKSLELLSRAPQGRFLVGTSVFLGDHEAGHSIYEVHVDGVYVPIRTKIQNR